ncbi:HAD family hydrolase [Geomicrobium sediminis]|uniref:FMN phosphatase YigB (HAD superfamily) n=1 Tax=Geomicrobium sediminis TaxID=1347788 RepID=A0ABS2PBM4_9BACL|nr:HAD family hydrolase [Geomicrobium sediminis]MBM7632808.1 FMN phosphatase YigB (HAD superfamily) [Geomicrobium sediminis]
MTNIITFDLDGTLMQNPFVKFVFPAIEKELQDVLNDQRPIISEIVAMHNDYMKQGETTKAYDWDLIVTEFLIKSNCVHTLSVEQLVKKHAAPPDSYLLEAGSISALMTLRKKGYRLVALTNGFYKYQFPVMERLGLAPLFDQIVTPEEAGCAKPDPQILQAVYAHGTVVGHVGDRIDHDVVMANQEEIPSIWIRHTFPEWIKRATMSERIQLAQPLIKEKYEKETGTQTISEECQPNYIVSSIEELNRIFT